MIHSLNLEHVLFVYFTLILIKKIEKQNFVVSREKNISFYR